jgi:hypothetical protein
MVAVNGKSTSRKSMRVATIFTGAAALTVGVTQVANAQDIAHSVGKGASKHIQRTVHPAGKVDGSIRYYSDCGALGVHDEYMHYSTSVSYGGGVLIYTSYCFGYYGVYVSPPGAGIRRECGGNNHGYLYGYEKGDEWSETFGPGTGYKNIFKTSLYGVVINSWTGADTCGEAPDYGGGNG